MLLKVNMFSLKILLTTAIKCFLTSQGTWIEHGAHILEVAWREIVPTGVSNKNNAAAPSF